MSSSTQRQVSAQRTEPHGAAARVWRRHFSEAKCSGCDYCVVANAYSALVERAEAVLRRMEATPRRNDPFHAVTEAIDDLRAALREAAQVPIKREPGASDA